MRILGISSTHDSSVCVLNDGKIERFYKEERLTRKKRDHTPFTSLMKVYEEFGETIDHVVLSSPSPNTSFDLGIFCEKIFKKPVKYVCDQHHLQHASLAFYDSGFDECITVVVDRNGSKYEDYFRESESVYYCSYPNQFKEIYKSFWKIDIGDQHLENILNSLRQNNQYGTYVCDSHFNITKVYESATTLIGEHPLENGKTMGLASYGKDSKFYRLFDNSIPNDKYFYHLEKDWHPAMPMSVFKKYDHRTTRKVTEENYQFYADYAFQVQKQTQIALGDLIEKYASNFNTKNICITGGYGLNIVSNAYLIDRFPEKTFFFEPLSDDSGNSIGCALLLYHQLTQSPKKFNSLMTFFHGCEHVIPQKYKNCDDDYIVDCLLNKKSVGVYNGMAESGPRSLGNRSILFDCRVKNSRDIVNRIKKREWYRPFAAICLESDARNIFDMGSVISSEYMTINFKIKPQYMDNFPGIVHVDGTCRIQTIKEDHHLFNLLSKIKEKIGYGILLNTSFNLAGEPLVETPEEALNVLNSSDLDVIWFPKTNQYIEK